MAVAAARARSLLALAALAGMLCPPAHADGEGAPRPVHHLSRPAVLYASNCAGCHGHSGRSVSEIPTLVDRVGYFARIPAGRAYLAEVPNVAMSALNDEDLALMLNWLLHTYSARQLPADFRDYTADEVGRYRQQRIIPWQRRQELVAQLVAVGEVADAGVLQ